MLKTLRILGNIEGVSYLLLLFVAMPMKYYFGMPMAVKIVGMAHGVLFILYIVFATKKNTPCGYVINSKEDK